MSVATLTGLAQLTIRYATTQQVVGQNQLFFLKDDNWSNDELAQLVLAAGAQWPDALEGVTNSSVSVVAVQARACNTDPWGLPLAELFDTPLPGTDTDDPLPYASSATIRFLPEPGVNTARGYVRHIGLSEGQATGNQIDSASRNALSTAWSNFVSAVVTSLNEEDPAIPCDHVVVSLFDGFTLDTHPDGTVTKLPTPRTTALAAGVAGYLCRPAVGRAVSRSGIRA